MNTADTHNEHIREIKRRSTAETKVQLVWNDIWFLKEHWEVLDPADINDRLQQMLNTLHPEDKS